MDLATATIEDFQRLESESFDILDDENGALELTRVEALPKRDDAARTPFSLIFKGRHEGPPAQGTFRLAHADAGTIELFLVPIADEDGTYVYEAVFG